MNPAGPARQTSPRKGAGSGPAPSVARRRSVGWPALLFSIGFHGVIFAAAAWFVVGGQGDAGVAGQDLANEEAASTPVPVFLPVPPKPPEEAHPTVPTRPVKALRTANMPRLLAKTQQAEILMPEWDMKPFKPIQAAPPPPPMAKPAESKPTPVASTPPSSSNGKAARTQKKAAGTGQGNTTGNATIAGQAPKLISSYPPPYPASARKAHIEGIATIKVSVGSSGRVLDCSLWSSTGNADLDNAALRAVKGYRFTPATNGAADVLIKVRFSLS